jgi:hypothetical protein
MFATQRSMAGIVYATGGSLINPAHLTRGAPRRNHAKKVAVNGSVLRTFCATSAAADLAWISNATDYRVILYVGHYSPGIGGS